MIKRSFNYLLNAQKVAFADNSDARVHLRTCIGVKYDLELLPRFIQYYKDLGVVEFHITLSASDKNEPNLKTAESILKEYGISVSNIWIGPYREHIRNQYLCSMIESLDKNDWILTADCDEFQEYPKPLKQFIKELDKNNIEWVQGAVVDRCTKSGEIPTNLDQNLSLSEQFPAKFNFHRLKPEPKGGAFINGEKLMPKVVLHKKHLKLSTGNHVLADPNNNKKYKQVLKVNHFKWFGSVLEKMERIIKDDISNVTKKENQLQHLTKHGKVNLPELSIVDI